MEFRILGPLEVVHDGRSLPLGGTRERAVLALLLLSPNQVVSAERLAEDLWGDDPPERAIHSLQVFVSRLRKSLREAGSDEIVVTQGRGYLVRLDPADLDAARFERLVASARDQGRQGAHDRAAARLLPMA